MEYDLMTLDELEREQSNIHEQFERAKSECYDKWVESTRLSEEYMKIEEIIKKRKAKKA